MTKSVYVQFEGIDGAGKSTLMTNVYAKLAVEHSIRALATREPGAAMSPATKTIRELLKNPDLHLEPTTKLHLLLADRNEHMAKVVLPALANGEIVLQDRGFLSTYAYQVGGVGYDADFIKVMNEATFRGAFPDIVVYMDVNPGVAWERIKDRARDDFEQKDFLIKVAKAYKTAIATLPKHIDVISLDDKHSINSAADMVIDRILDLYETPIWVGCV